MGRRRVETVDQAMGLVRERGILPLAPEPSIDASLVEAVAGDRPKGSWWGHPAGSRIYELASAMEAAGDVLVAKVVRGKVAFVHRALWPALLRVATDGARAAGARSRASPEGRALLDRVERDGEARLDLLAAGPGAPPERALAAAAKEIEAAGLVHVASVHTERGRHAKVLRTWRRAVPDAAPWREAARLDLAAAEALLAERGASITARATGSRSRSGAASGSGSRRRARSRGG